MDPLQRILDEYPVMILDGALATELERRGCDLHDALWSAKVLLESPQVIKEVHADYFAAGADCAITATYQATYQGFAQRGQTEAEAAGLMSLAIRLAIEARDEFWSNSANHPGRPKPLVAASIGSYGAYLANGSEYTGEYPLDESALMHFHRPRLKLLAESAADLLACETIPSLVEARALARLLDEFPSRYAWISFSARDGSHNSHGERLADCAAEMDGYERVAAVGVNCTAPRHIPAAIEAIRSATDKPVVVYPNSGDIYHAADKTWISSAETGVSGDQARTWLERGARIIGGCCSTTPLQIQDLVENLRPH